MKLVILEPAIAVTLTVAAGFLGGSTMMFGFGTIAAIGLLIHGGMAWMIHSAENQSNQGSQTTATGIT